MRTCFGVRQRLSAYLEGDLDAVETRVVASHLGTCSGCAQRWRTLEGSLALLAEMPRLAASERIASRVLDRLEVETRGPGLALLFRPAWAARPLMLPSLVPAALVLVSVLAGVVALDQDPRQLSAVVRGEGWEPRGPASGTEANPLFPSSSVTVPRVRTRDPRPADVLARMGGEGTLFLETVVARDGSVSAVTLLQGDSEQAQPFLDALRRERFEPARLRGRPVAVSVYRLISRMEVRAPNT